MTFSCVRSESGAGVTSAAHQESPEDGDSDDDRGSGEYYSGEEFHDDDIMLTKDRWALATLRQDRLEVLTHQELVNSRMFDPSECWQC